VIRAKLLVLVVLLAMTSLVVHAVESWRPAAQAEEPSLREIFSTVRGWSSGPNIPLSPTVVTALDLDDYLFRSYRRATGQVTLYIGYYRTARKVGASHDPLVCFQGQGWQVRDRAHGEYQLRGTPSLTISYASMVAERGADRELVLYWFQTRHRTWSNTFAQKLDIFWQRIWGRSEENAFVRLHAPLRGRPPEVVKREILDFLESFYPTFFYKA